MFVQLLFPVRAVDVPTLSIVRHNLILSTRKTTKVRLLVTATLLSICMQFVRGIIWPSCLVEREQFDRTQVSHSDHYDNRQFHPTCDKNLMIRVISTKECPTYSAELLQHSILKGNIQIKLSISRNSFPLTDPRDFIENL